MTGRIKLLKNGEPIQKDVHLPELGYGYDQPAEHDQTCGTYGLHEFQLPHEECLEQFVCDVDPANKELSEFAGCIVSSFARCMHFRVTTCTKNNCTLFALFAHNRTL